MEIPDQDEVLAIWALSDGRAGNAAQAMGLGEAVARRLPARLLQVDAPPGRVAAALPAAWSHALGRVLPGWPETGHAALPAPGPGLVIGAGRRVAPLVAALGLQGARTVQVLDPRMPHDAFDLVVVPEHDAVAGPNILTGLGAPGRVTPERIATEAEAWRARLDGLPEPRLAVLLGGPGPMARWGAEDPQRLAEALTGLAAEGWTLLVTASRRTDPGLIALLNARLDPARHLLHTGGENPYPAILGLAEAVLVTADTVNMASEAGSSGLPVHVFHVAGPSEKARRFHASLEARGIARPFARRIERWSYAPLAEADRLAGEIVRRLGLW